VFDVTAVIPGFDVLSFSTSVQITPALLIPADPNRVLLYVTNDATNNLFMAPDTPGYQTNHAAFVISNNQTMRWTWALDGPLSTFAWWLWLQSGPGFVTCTVARWWPRRLEAQ
jgi:hypothetical protein